MTISVPSPVKKMWKLLVSCGLSKRRSSVPVCRVDDADRTGEGADGQVTVGGERHWRRHRQQEGVVGARQPFELVEQLPRRPVTNLDAPRLAPADDDESLRRR